jgi:protein-disulfide isomerase
MKPFLLGLVLALASFGADPSPKGSGDPNAPITIEVFSDFQCPACKLLHQTTMKQVHQDYVSRGRVYIVHREFPLQMHKYAREAACLASASARVNKYERVCDALFQNQEKWSADGNLQTVLAGVLTPAELKRVSALAKDPVIAAEVQRDVDLGMRAGINQTPTMFISGRGKRYPVAGPVNYNILRRLLDQMLAN